MNLQPNAVDHNCGYRRDMDTKNALVLGTGAWGTTFAKVLSDSGVNVTMWGRSPITVGFVNDHENSAYLPGVILPENIVATTDVAEVSRLDPDLIALAVPTYAVEEVASIFSLDKMRAPIVSLIKGIDVDTGHTMVEVIANVGDGVSASRIAALSGPNLSREIAQAQPTSACIACADFDTAKQIADTVSADYFQLYPSRDMMGVELAGASKNVIAIAVGAAEGMGFGSNARAALMIRGLSEMTRLGVALGADAETYSGLAGVGDLIATCSSRLSRNYSLGYHLGRGRSLDDALSRLPGVAEGARSALPLLRLAQQNGVDMPITQALVSVLHEGASVEDMGVALFGCLPQSDWDNYPA